MSTSEVSEVGASVEEVPEISPPPPPTRTPSDRLREKIVRDSSSSTQNKEQANDTAPVNGDTAHYLEIIPNSENSEAMPPHQSILGKDHPQKDTEKAKDTTWTNNIGVPISANIDKKVDAAIAGTGESPEEAPSNRPGAFQVAGIGGGGDDDDGVAPTAPTAPSDFMDIEDLSIAAELAEEGKPVEASKLDDLVVNMKSRKIRIGIFLLFAVLVGAIIGGVLGAQKRKEKALGECIVEDPSKLGNGQCDGDEYNTEKCRWDEGDCLILNQYPDCALTPKQSARLGDGSCDGLPWFSHECGIDAGDCIDCLHDSMENFTSQVGNSIGNGQCDPPFNFPGCSFDGGDCAEFNDKFPDCRLVDMSCSSFNATFPGCVTANPEFLGDGTCDYLLNNEACAYDSGDCRRFNDKFPDCRMGDLSCSSFNVTYPGCITAEPEWIGDGRCDSHWEHNTIECGWDGGDCDEFNKARCRSNIRQTATTEMCYGPK